MMTQNVVYGEGMTRWAPDAALRLERAAMELFEEQGYDATTVPQITARAGLTTRTFFRHFSDKREVLFLRDREFPAVIQASLVDAPGGDDPLEAARAGLLSAATALEPLRANISRRQAVIRSDDRLRERELLKSARLADAVSAGLLERGFADEQVRIVALLAVLVFELALTDWTASDDGRTLVACLARTWADLGGILSVGTTSETPSD